MQIGLLGFGEAGAAMASTLLALPHVSVFAYDHQYLDAASRDARGGDLDVSLLASPAALAQSTDVIISVVTADEAKSAALSLLPFLQAGHVFFDGNSVSPGTKQAISASFNAHDCQYVDLAIMAPIHPRGHKTPMLVSGPDEAEICKILSKLHFAYEWRGTAIGDASTVKMLRSILIKGMESLVCECVTAAEGLGLDTEILTSAGKTLHIDDMPALADYVMERAAVHGRRRAAEMREVAKTLSEMALSNHLATAIAAHQDMVADMQLSDMFDGDVPRDRAQLAHSMRTAQKAD